jgi:hypothetical protein
VRNPEARLEGREGVIQELGCLSPGLKDDTIRIPVIGEATGRDDVTVFRADVLVDDRQRAEDVFEA